MADDLETEVMVDGERISLSTIGDVDMSEVDAVRFTLIPKGKFRFQIDGPGELTTVGEGDEQYARITLKAKIVEVVTLIDKKESADEMIDKVHTEMFNLKTKDAIGRYAAFLEDSGYAQGGSLNESLANLDNHVFLAKIRHTKSKNNADIIFANLDFKDVKQNEAA